MRLARALVLRLLFGLLSLVFISFVTFVADELAPGDAVTVLAGEKASPARLRTRAAKAAPSDRTCARRSGRA